MKVDDQDHPKVKFLLDVHKIFDDYLGENSLKSQVSTKSQNSGSDSFSDGLEMKRQQILVAYPCGILYAVFALLTVF